MSGWRVGDLALCVAEEQFSNYPNSGWGPKLGGIYHVSEVALFLEGDVALNFSEDTAYISIGGFSAYNFRKIKPDTEGANEDDAAWLKDLLTKKVKA